MGGDTGCWGECGRRGMNSLLSGRTSSLFVESYWTLPCMTMLSWHCTSIRSSENDNGLCYGVFAVWQGV